MQRTAPQGPVEEGTCPRDCLFPQKQGQGCPGVCRSECYSPRRSGGGGITRAGRHLCSYPSSPSLLHLLTGQTQPFGGGGGEDR